MNEINTKKGLKKLHNDLLSMMLDMLNDLATYMDNYDQITARVDNDSACREDAELILRVENIVVFANALAQLNNEWEQDT